MGRPLKKKLKTIVRKTRRALLNFAGENQDTVSLESRNATIDPIQAERAARPPPLEASTSAKHHGGRGGGEARVAPHVELRVSYVQN